jgi:hypothetical protein
MLLRRAEKAVDDAKRTISAGVVVAVLSLVVALVALAVAVSR